MHSTFLLGSERSGSNLLRTLLGNHSNISAPIAPHLGDVFFHRFKHYLPLNDDKRQELIQDIDAYVNHNFNGWEVSLNSKDESLKSNKSFIEFLDFSFTQKAISEKKNYYFCKDNHNHRYALGILKDIPDSKFIYLYRDPRDQVASWMKTPLFLHSPYDAIQKWKSEQEDILALKYFYQLDMCSIKYEDLVDNPEKEITRVLNFIGVEVEPACFQTNKDNKEAVSYTHLTLPTIYSV